MRTEEPRVRVHVEMWNLEGAGVVRREDYVCAGAGWGLVVCIFAMLAAGGLEYWRLALYRRGRVLQGGIVDLNVFLQVPEYLLIGLSEVRPAYFPPLHHTSPLVKCPFAVPFSMPFFADLFVSEEGLSYFDHLIVA